MGLGKMGGISASQSRKPWSRAITSEWPHSSPFYLSAPFLIISDREYLSPIKHVAFPILVFMYACLLLSLEA